MGKKTHNSGINKKGNSSSNVSRTPTKGNMRSKSTIQRLNMYKGGKPIRDKDGRVTGGDLIGNTVGNKEAPNVARIAPDRRWFGNTRTISQTELDKFRDDMSVREADPYSVILRRKKIPMALLQDSKKIKNVNLLETESFEHTYGSKTQRKRPKLSATFAASYENLAQNACERVKEYDVNPSKDSQNVVEIDSVNDVRKDDLFAKGQSKRIWGELYKVLDCSDVVLQIVDARNVPGTRCAHIENHIRKNASHKHLITIINKCDLVPAWVTRRWMKILSAEFPTVAFHAHMTKSFGKSQLINLLRQFSKLHADKRQISVGVIGYPNVGKSSVINVLVGSKCCKAAPVPGETKIWQYIALTKRISLIDCPGIVYFSSDDSEVETVLKGVVRAERLEDPVDYISAILRRIKPEYIMKQYGITEWVPNLIENHVKEEIGVEGSNAKDTVVVGDSDAAATTTMDGEYDEKEEGHIKCLTKIALKMGKLLKGGEPDIKHIAVIMINDWQRGKLPYFVAPPRAVTEDEDEEDEEDEEEVEMQEEEEEDEDDEDEEDDKRVEELYDNEDEED